MGCGSSSPSLNSTTVPDREPRDDASLKEKDSITKLPAIQENGELKDENSHGPLSSVEKMTSTRMSKPVNKITMLHFNDVYNIEPREKEPVGGAARFVSKVQSYQDENPLIFFSGDCLNPSLMSTVTRGKHMIPVLNKIGVHAALYGNHDFDFGVDELLEFKEETKFPWLLSNVIDNTTGKRLAEGEESLLLEWGGRKIGIIGLVEEEWLVTLATVDPKDITFQGFVEVGRKLAKELREKGAELIVALTHMRVPNDLQLLSSDADIDLILGGHDHHYEVRQENGITFCKSGTDFREMTRLTVNFENGSKKPAIETFKVEITSDIVEEQEMKELADKNLALLEKSMEVELGVMKVELDGRFATVRTQESNLGNFVTDIMRSATQADAALLNGGTFRSDIIHPDGPFKVKDLVSILPMMDTLVVIEVSDEYFMISHCPDCHYTPAGHHWLRKTSHGGLVYNKKNFPGRVLVEALENGVSQYPRHEGRFPQVSGIEFSFNPNYSPGKRVIQSSVKVDKEPIDIDKNYSLCLKTYIAEGKDGYDMFKSCRVLVDEENGPILPTIVQNHFESVKIVTGARKSVSRHRQSLVMSHEDLAAALEKERSRLAPQVEGRIKIETEDVEEKAAAPEDATLSRRMSRMRQATLSGDNLQDIVESPDEEGLDQESGISHNGTPLNREVVKSNANCYPDTVKASEPSVDENNNDICNEEQNKEEMNVLSSSNGLIEDVGTTSLRKEERSHDVSS